MSTHRTARSQTEQVPLTKERLFAVVTIATPLLFFLLLEFTLRLVSYGPNLSLFHTEKIGSRRYYVMNPDVKLRYFQRVEFSPNTSADYFLMPKPIGTYRIFVLGGSTTVGFPYGYVGSFSTFLRQRLQSAFPHKRIEIINLGMTATNSYTVLDLAKEVVNYQPDLLLVYDGHNEFYGALGIASHEHVGGTHWAVKLHLWLVHQRIYNLVRNMIALLAPSSQTAPASGTLMERLAQGKYIPWGNSEYRECLENFKRNIRDLADLAREHGVPLILSTQASNLRDHPPFVSELDNTPPPNQSTIRQLFTEGLRYREQGQFPQALTVFRSVQNIDSFRADTRYAIAKMLDTLGSFREALREYSRARDYDMLRFRTSSDFNDAIRELGQQNGVWVADVETFLSQHARDSIIGNDLILEHLHPNLKGYFLIAKCYFETMRHAGLLAPSEEWRATDTISDEGLWEEKSITEIDIMAASRRIQFLTSGWPFRMQQTPAAPKLPQAIQEIADSLASARITWEQAHVMAAEWYERNGNLDKAEREYKALMDQIPVNVSAYLRLAQLLVRTNNLTEARKVLERSLEIEETFHGFSLLGKISHNDKSYAKAISLFDKARGLATTRAERNEAMFFAALGVIESGDTAGAINRLRDLLQQDPSFRPARTLLSQLHK